MSHGCVFASPWFVGAHTVGEAQSGDLSHASAVSGDFESCFVSTQVCIDGDVMEMGRAVVAPGSGAGEFDGMARFE